MPTLYILPTNDRDITAAVLTYPIDKSGAKLTKGSQKSLEKNRVNWLFLADHSLSDERSKPSSLTAEKLAAIVEQQLRTLAINNLQGIIVQSSAVSLTDSLSTISATANKDNVSPLVSKISQSSSILKKSLDSKIPQSSPTQSLLPLTVAKLSQRVPTKQYWQAGRHERWAEHQKLSAQANNKALISAQDCQQGKQWQDLSGQLTLEVLTGWSEINDASVWDCSLSITSQSPIQIVHYNAADPQQPSLATVQTPTSQKIPSTSEDSAISSRLILDTATHKGGWQLQSLLCSAKPFLVDIKTLRLQPTSWLSHSSSKVSVEALVAQQIDRVLTYDQQPLAVALTIGPNTNKVIHSHK